MNNNSLNNATQLITEENKQRNYNKTPLIAPAAPNHISYYLPSVLTEITRFHVVAKNKEVENAV